MSDNYPDVNRFIYSNNPDDYIFTDHIREDVLPDENRHLSWDRIETTIEEGDLEPATGNADVEFVRDYDGVNIYVLVGYDESKDRPVAITAWPAVKDVRTALESELWTKKQLDQILRFNNADPLETYL